MPRAMKPRTVVYVWEVPKRSWRTVRLRIRALRNYCQRRTGDGEYFPVGFGGWPGPYLEGSFGI